MTAGKAPHQPREAIAFTPVSRGVKRHDGWTAEKQRQFIAVIAETGSTQAAVQATGMSFTSAYALKRARDGQSFSDAWDAARARGVAMVREKLMDHSLNGIPEPVYHAGKQVGERRRFNHRSMMWLIEHADKAKAAGIDEWGNCACDAAKREAEARQRVNMGVRDLAKSLGILL